MKVTFSDDKQRLGTVRKLVLTKRKRYFHGHQNDLSSLPIGVSETDIFKSKGDDELSKFG